MSMSKAQLLAAKKKLASSKKTAKAAVKTSYSKFLKAKNDTNKKTAMTSLGSGAVLMNDCNSQGASCKCGQPGQANDEADHTSQVTIIQGSSNTATATNADVVVHKGKRRRIVWEILTPGWVFDDDQPIYIAPVPGQNEDKNFLKRFGWKLENDRTKLIVCGNAGGGKRVSCKYNLRMWKGSSTNFAALDPALDCED